ncbi:N-acetylmuramoyl-L-alanine amidase [Actinomyces naeslundii]|uniref:N-acetylmuramoyl-L-alanine amidase n=4 Tax=Actinomyces naeslundii TaxID=1655 RepID=UPI000C7732EE|nr:N-acetylmuramoyl-L-alanine amidase [Actinomyces naeslundii]PKY95598.1 N-acetylmuramoyl-L-alanine amidase [Actinomyces naeslundii]
MKVPRPRVRTVYRAVGLAALAPLLLSGLVPVAVAAPEVGDPGGSGSSSGHGAGSAGQADSPAPVQILDLTTSGGQATDIAQSGLDDARPDAGKGASNDSRPDAGAGTSDDPPHGSEASTPSAKGASAPGGGNRVSALPALATGGRVPSVLPAATDPQADAALLTDPLQVDRFLVAGFTWAGGADLPEGVRIYLRVRENGTWSPWYLNEAADSGRDDRETTAGTGEFVTGGADAVQASVVGSSLPAGLKLVLVPSQPQGEEVLDSGDVSTTEAAPTPVVEEVAAWQPGSGRAGTSGSIGGPAVPSAPEPGTPLTASAVSTTTALSPSTVPATVSATVPAAVPVSVPAAVPIGTTANGLPVPVTTRAEWGANASYMSWDPDYESAGHVVVHHTAGTNNYSAGQSASIVRGIYYYHAVTLDWGDIGYNFLIDKYGTVFEGRSGSVAAPAGEMSVGAHARGVNTGTMGLSMMGDYSSVSPSDAQLSSVGRMAGWFLKRAGIADANGRAGLHVWTTERYQAGSTISMPRILGHRDVGYTTCPGNVGYSKLGTIRTIAQTQIDGGSESSTAPGAVTLRGAILTAWTAAGGERSKVGLPTTSEIASSKGGVYQRFEHGVAYWTRATGAQFVAEPVLSAWGGYWYEKGSMGYPRSGVVSGPGGSFRQSFEGGVAYWRSGGKASFVRGAILTAWTAAGGERSKVGLPTTSEIASSKGGVYQRFEHGVAYWTRATGAQFVAEPVLSAWGGYWYEKGSMGYPRSGVVSGPGGSFRQSFEGGVAYWRSGGKASFVRGGILTAWTAAGGERSKVGLPVGYEVRQADGTVTQAFEKGQISVSPTGTATIR